MKVVYFLRALFCDFLMYVSMLVLGIVCFPIALTSRSNTYKVIRLYCRFNFFVLKYLANLKIEIRGQVPKEPCLICAKHQSFLDILMLVSVVPDCRFIMKHQLVFLPVIGFYARKIGCVAVNREKRGGTVKKMISDLEKEGDRQTIVYPQGTRVLPKSDAPYKYGAGVIYQSLNKKCFLVATNTGMFWARRSPYRYPGVAIIDFFDTVEPGLDTNSFISVIKEKIEDRSNALMDEACKESN